MTDSVLVLKDLALAGEMRVKRFLQRADVIFVHAIEPGFRLADFRGGGQAHDSFPAARYIELLRAKIPFPQAVVRELRREPEPLAVPFERLHRAGGLRHILPEER